MSLAGGGPFENDDSRQRFARLAAEAEAGRAARMARAAGASSSAGRLAVGVVVMAGAFVVMIGRYFAMICSALRALAIAASAVCSATTGLELLALRRCL